MSCRILLDPPETLDILAFLGHSVNILLSNKFFSFSQTHTVPLLEINPGKDLSDDNIEVLYAVPNKKKKKKKKKKGEEPLNPPTIWPNYDEVGSK